ncbi:MAG TPA: M48 family metalloprotease [Melioribacteraceae bacterium]|nr:M48 family metalloprotease [Melioribacteraceae bacterium]
MQKLNKRGAKMKSVYYMFILLIIISVNIYSQSELFTSRQNNYVREGAGAYFDLIEILPAGKKVILIEKEEKWLKVKLENGKTGYISENCVSEKKQQKEISSKFADKWSKSNVSKSGLAGAIKGLKGVSAKTEKGNPDELIKNLNIPISNMELKTFYATIQSENNNKPDNKLLNKLTKFMPEYDPEYEEQQIGFGIASRLIQNNVSTNKKLQKYLNTITRTLISRTKFFDWEFNVIVLDNKVVDGFAVPGGYIFITTGAINNCKDEAELAAVIAHEMGHILRKHGLQEMSKRTGHIKMDDAFAEMDESLGEKDEETKQVEEDLEDVILSSYENVVHKRLLDYELEADRIAATLLYNTGYDVNAIVRLHKRLATQHTVSNDVFDSNYLKPNDLSLRVNKIDQFINENFEENKNGALCLVRFNNNVNK